MSSSTVTASKVNSSSSSPLSSATPSVSVPPSHPSSNGVLSPQGNPKKLLSLFKNKQDSSSNLTGTAAIISSSSAASSPTSASSTPPSPSSALSPSNSQSNTPKGSDPVGKFNFWKKTKSTSHSQLPSVLQNTSAQSLAAAKTGSPLTLNTDTEEGGINSITSPKSAFVSSLTSPKTSYVRANSSASPTNLVSPTGGIVIGAGHPHPEAIRNLIKNKSSLSEITRKKLQPAGQSINHSTATQSTSSSLLTSSLSSSSSSSSSTSSSSAASSLSSSRSPSPLPPSQTANSPPPSESTPNPTSTVSASEFLPKPSDSYYTSSYSNSYYSSLSAQSSLSSLAAFKSQLTLSLSFSEDENEKKKSEETQEKEEQEIEEEEKEKETKTVDSNETSTFSTTTFASSSFPASLPESPSPASPSAPASSTASPKNKAKPTLPRTDSYDQIPAPVSPSHSSSGSSTTSTPSKETKKAGTFLRLIAEENLEIEQLRKAAWNGVPMEVRPTVWKLLTGYLPPAKKRREGTLQRKRNEYRGYCDEYNRQTDESRTEEEMSILRQIRADIPRTSPGLNFFRQPLIAASLTRCLYLFALRHPATGYVQGMNDLTTPFYAVYAKELRNDADVCGGGEVDLTGDEIDLIEADVYWNVSWLIDGIQDHYTFAQPGIQRQIHRLKELVERVDSALAKHLENHQVQFLHFAFRWMNCLLMRELSLPLILRLWDSYFSHESPPSGPRSFHVYVCVALLETFAEKLKQMDFGDLVTTLQSLPTKDWDEKKVDVMIAQAFLYESLYQNARI